MEIAAAFQRRGLLYVLSSPSGAGKSTIARMLLASDDGVAMSVSATTRPIRPGEEEGVDYHFVSDAEFDAERAEFRHRQLAPPDIDRPEQRDHPPHRRTLAALGRTSRLTRINALRH